MTAMLAFVRHFLRHWQRALLFTHAGALTFSTILAMVPLMVMVIALLSLLPLAASVQTELQNFIFSNFVASSGQTIQTQLSHFVDRVRDMSWWGVGFLALNAIGILLSLEQGLNAIWQAQTRPYYKAIGLYALILSVGPLLLALSMALSLLVIQELSWPAWALPLSQAKWLWPMLVSFIGYGVVYKIIPNTRIQWPTAALSALIATLLFEAAKRAFAWYFTYFPSYERIYGAVAAIPLFFLWLYCCWLIVFFSAVVGYVWQTYRH